ncbi:hypothetical protein F5Y16DRAFT_414672 [Xylariaceae sp. FL0255]|nr:hypothetical protein F5Y16DRAFT_414672 [Xylariaceae sp. FL0255]
MRLYWYAGTSTALAAGVVAYAFNQRANFYSAMVYLSQNNLSLMILINLVLFLYASLVWGLQRLCYGPLRPVEIEQLYEKAWFAITETCLAMTIFRDEVGAWFLVMFTALVTGKVWEWIGEGRVEVLEQQPPANPRLFHTRLSISLLLSLAYDAWLFTYAVHSVIQQARPNMMVMFLFEFAILATCSFRTAFRYLLSLIEADIVRKQTRSRLEDRRRQAREQRADILRRRESDDPVVADAAQQEELPAEEDIDEIDIEVAGWESKGHWVLSLDLLTDLIKLGIYSGFFAILMMFYGLPIHIMRDLFMTARSFVKRLGALMRYRKALQDMNKYPDATPEDLGREDTCIICREEMRPWDASIAGAVERSRPKKLPCGHILHFGCLKGWLERQQVCPTCRRSVVMDGPAPNGAPAAPPPAGGQPQAPPGLGAPGAAGGGNVGQPAQARGNMRVFQLGPIRLGFAQGNAQNMQDLADRLRLPLDAVNPPAAPAVIPPTTAQAAPTGLNGALNSIEAMQTQLQEMSNHIQQEMYTLQVSQAEMQVLYALTAELNRLRQLPAQPPPNSTYPVGQAGHITTQQPPYSFPGHASHVTAPAISRHGGASYANAVPSGSQDLPEGMAIPPGWSLLPLQRLDGQPFQQQQPIPQTQAQVISTPAHPVDGPAETSNVSSSSVPEDSVRPDDAVQSDAPNHVGPESTTSDVAAPTPVIPQWGGASQLFAGREVGGLSRGEPTTRQTDSNSESTTDSDGHDEQPSSSDDENNDNSDDADSDRDHGRSKVRSVTIEEAEEDE